MSIPLESSEMSGRKYGGNNDLSPLRSRIAVSCLISVAWLHCLPQDSWLVPPPSSFDAGRQITRSESRSLVVPPAKTCPNHRKECIQGSFVPVAYASFVTPAVLVSRLGTLSKHSAQRFPSRMTALSVPFHTQSEPSLPENVALHTLLRSCEHDSLASHWNWTFSCLSNASVAAGAHSSINKGFMWILEFRPLRMRQVALQAVPSCMHFSPGDFGDNDERTQFRVTWGTLRPIEIAAGLETLGFHRMNPNSYLG